MDFFAAQDHARKQTKKLVVYFILAVIGIIASIYIVCSVVFSLYAPALLGGAEGTAGSTGAPAHYQSSGSTSRGNYYSVNQRSTAPAPAASRQGGGQGGSYGDAPQQEFSLADIRWWNPELLAIVSGVVLVVILGASALKTMQLRGGGGVVARSLGGRQVDAATRDPNERRLMNVVEEMALASGTPMPEVYVLDDEAGINAFAAGHSPHDAAVAVTRGCMEQLSRDELQGVIAHEFSHILNGDMRLNVRLIGILFGILVLAVIGEGMMRSAFYSGAARRSSRDGNNNNNAAVVFMLLGIAVMAIGYIGIIFGRLIQSAISRQREFLADASAVQFTRYPDGIANALIKIGGAGSKLESQHAQETAHMFFACGLRHNMGGGFATHPPLPQRIKAIKPDWDGQFEVSTSARSARKAPPPAAPSSVAPASARGGSAAGAQTAAGNIAAGAAASTGSAAAGLGGSGVGAGGAIGAAGVAGAMGAMAAAGKNGSNAGGGKGRLNAQQAMEAIGTLAAGHIAHAQEIHAQVKDLLGDAGSDPASAKALIYALMLCDDRSHYDAHLEWLGQQIEPELLERCRAYGERLKSAPEQLHLPLLELAMPALARLEKDRLLAFGERLKSLALRDEHLSFGELATVALMQRKIARKAQSTSAEPQTVGDADALAGAFSVLLTAVIRAGGVTDPTQAQTVLDSASAAAPLFSGLLSLQTSDAADSGKAQLEALETLGKAAPALKKQILAAATHAVSHDGHISPQEGEWLRLIAACMDCPMPPLVLG